MKTCIIPKQEPMFIFLLIKWRKIGYVSYKEEQRDNAIYDNEMFYFPLVDGIRNTKNLLWYKYAFQSHHVQQNWKEIFHILNQMLNGLSLIRKSAIEKCNLLLEFFDLCLLWTIYWFYHSYYLSISLNVRSVSFNYKFNFSRRIEIVSIRVTLNKSIAG